MTKTYPSSLEQLGLELWSWVLEPELLQPHIVDGWRPQGVEEQVIVELDALGLLLVLEVQLNGQDEPSIAALTDLEWRL